MADELQDSFTALLSWHLAAQARITRAAFAAPFFERLPFGAAAATATAVRSISLATLFRAPDTLVAQWASQYGTLLASAAASARATLAELLPAAPIVNPTSLVTTAASPASRT